MNTRRHALFALLASLAALAGCASPQVSDYAQQHPKLALDRYFNGRIHAYGIFQKRGGGGEQTLALRWQALGCARR